MTQETPALIRRGDRQYTWDDTVAAIGKDYSGGKDRVAQETISLTSVMRYCEVWEYGNPIYWYEDVAKQAGYRNAVVPWSSTQQTFINDSFWRPGEPTHFPPGIHRDAGGVNPAASEEEGQDRVPMPPHTNSVRTDMDIEFFEPVCVGDRLTVKGEKLVNVRPRKTRIGYGAFMNWAQEIYNQQGQLVAKNTRGSYAYNPGADS